MAALMESESRGLAVRDLADISEQLAADVARVVLDSDGFSVDDYFALDGNYLVEFDDGRLQVLPMPDIFHQAIIAVIYELLGVWSAAHDPRGRRVFSPFKVMLGPRRYCEPDVSYMLGEHAGRRHRTDWDGADVVFEVLSGSNRKHDTVTKRTDYAAAGIAEYWIVDPADRSVTVLHLSSGQYRPGTAAASRVLAGFSVDVADLFARADAESQ